MQVIEIKRSFAYNGIKLLDPNPAIGPDQVREFFASQYPELNNAVVEGPVTKNGTATYTFARAAGAKGAALQRAVVPHGCMSARAALAAACLPPAPSGAQRALVESTELPSAAPRVLLNVVLSNNTAAPMPIPGSAFGCWG